MDLLGNYSSSDDEDGSERSVSPPTPIKKTTVHQGALPPAMPSPQKLAAKKPSPTTTSKNGKSKTNRRGKKLISLHSVLPPHILEQLTKSEATGGFEDSSDDDDNNNKKEDDDDDDEEKKQAGKKKAPSSSSSSQDPGISSFLSALNSAKTMNASTSLSKMKYNKTAKKPPDSSSSNNKLGSAFTSFTSTTTTRTKKDGTTLSSSSTTKRSNANESPPEERRRTPTGQEEGSPSHYKPLSLSPRTAFHPFRTAGVAAAPPVPNTATAAAAGQQYSHNPRQFTAPPPPMAAAAASYPDPNDNNMMDVGSSRSKKRQLQKALRAGQLDQALAQKNNAATITNLEQARPDAFVPQEETYAVPTNGVRVAATTMYNPKAGTDVQADLAAVRGKGKNQINQLMASAANFELQQARQGGKNSNNRAGAKRKYGW